VLKKKFDPNVSFNDLVYAPATTATSATQQYNTIKFEKFVASVASVATPYNLPTELSDNSDAKVVAWINSHPPDLPDAQNHCAACGEYIEVYDVHWIYLADGALIHYSGKYDNKCWKRWQEIRRDNANTALKKSKGV